MEAWKRRGGARCVVCRWRDDDDDEQLSLLRALVLALAVYRGLALVMWVGRCRVLSARPSIQDRRQQL
jgi:hypothetical protein